MATKSLLFRAGVLLLSLSLLLSVFGCAMSEEDIADDNAAQSGYGAEESEETTKFDPTHTLPTDISYNGEKFTFLIRNESESISDMAVEHLADESSTMDKAVYARNMDVQDLYKVEFEFVTTTYDDFSRMVYSAVSGDPNLYDVIVGHGRTIFQGVTQAYYADWNELEYVDLSGEWWSQSARREWATPEGRIFAMNGDLSHMSIGNNSAMFFNKKILENAGVKSPYQQVYDNNWTLDTFIQTVKQIDGNLNHDETDSIDTDSFGYATERWRGPIYAAFCAGIGSFVKNEEGKYEIGLKNERIGSVTEKYIDLVKNSGTSYFGSDLDRIRSAFKSERVVFTDDNVQCAVQFKGTGLDFGIVPFPKADQAAPYASLVGSGTNTFAVIKTMSEERLSRSSLILEALACYGSRDVIPLYYETILSYQAMQDEHSLEMLRIIKNAGFFDLGHYTNYGQVGDLVRLLIEQPARYGSSIHTAIQVVEQSALSQLESWYSLDERY